MPLNSPDAEPLFRIFYLEDDPDLSEDLLDLLPAQLPGVQIDWAATIQEGLALLTTGQHYDLGLLDVRVPFRKGAFPEAHPEVAQTLRQQDVALLIYSAYVDSDDVQDFLQRKLTDPPIGVIRKGDGIQLADEIAAAAHEWLVELASRRVTSQLRQTFESPGDGDRCFQGTGAVLSLQQDIVDYWGYLDSEARQRVTKRFRVEEADGVVTRLTLIPFGA